MSSTACRADTLACLSADAPRGPVEVVLLLGSIEGSDQQVSHVGQAFFHRPHLCAGVALVADDAALLLDELTLTVGQVTKLLGLLTLVLTERVDRGPHRSLVRALGFERSDSGLRAQPRWQAWDERYRGDPALALAVNSRSGSSPRRRRA